MFRLFFVIVVASLIGCVNYRRYQKKEIIEERTDAKGRLVLKKFKQLISSPSHDKITTITEEYYTIGRVIREYGIDNPYFYDQKYLTERIYRGTQVYVFNKF